MASIGTASHNEIHVMLTGGSISPDGSVKSLWYSIALCAATKAHVMLTGGSISPDATLRPRCHPMACRAVRKQRHALRNP
jgi:hypothetical protein